MQDDIKLALAIQNAKNCKFDVVAMQEVRRTGSGIVTLDDESLKGWQLI